MKNRINNLLLFIGISMSLLWSCEENVTGVTLPYEEQLVIWALLESGRPIDNISITKTLPPLEEFDLKKAQITDAEVRINVDNKEYKLKNNGGDHYFTDEIKPEVGKTYTIIVEWKGKKAFGTTYIPDTVKINKIDYSFKRDNTAGHGYIKSFRVNFNYQGNSVFVLSSSNYFYSNNKIYRYDNIPADSSIDLFFDGQWVDDTTKNDPYNGKRDMTIMTYDPQFYNYYMTVENGDYDGVFSTSGTNVYWNIMGEGIGMIIGRSRTTSKY